MIDFAAARTAMVDCQVRPSDVTRYPIIAAMLDIAREKYVPNTATTIAYIDENIDLGAGRTMLAPRTLAKMLDAVQPDGSELVLHIGAGLGYGSALLSRLTQAVIAVEENAEFAAAAAAQLSADGEDTVIIEEGSLAAGSAVHGPYDLIFIEGAVEEIPTALTEQLSEHGKIIMLRTEGPLCFAEIGVRGANGFSTRRLFDANAPVLPGFEAKRVFTF